jgi:hypothetical protein
MDQCSVKVLCCLLLLNAQVKRRDKRFVTVASLLSPLYSAALYRKVGTGEKYGRQSTGDMERRTYLHRIQMHKIRFEQ